MRFIFFLALTVGLANVARSDGLFDAVIKWWVDWLGLSTDDDNTDYKELVSWLEDYSGEETEEPGSTSKPSSPQPPPFGYIPQQPPMPPYNYGQAMPFPPPFYNPYQQQSPYYPGLQPIPIAPPAGSLPTASYSSSVRSTSTAAPTVASTTTTTTTTQAPTTVKAVTTEAPAANSSTNATTAAPAKANATAATNSTG